MKNEDRDITILNISSMPCFCVVLKRAVDGSWEPAGPFSTENEAIAFHDTLPKDMEKVIIHYKAHCGFAFKDEE